MLIEFFQEWSLPVLIYSNKTVFPLMAGGMLLLGCGWKAWRDLLAISIFAVYAWVLMPSLIQASPLSHTLSSWLLNMHVALAYMLLSFDPIAREFEQAESL